MRTAWCKSSNTHGTKKNLFHGCVSVVCSRININWCSRIPHGSPEVVISCDSRFGFRLVHPPETCQLRYQMYVTHKNRKSRKRSWSGMERSRSWIETIYVAIPPNEELEDCIN